MVVQRTLNRGGGVDAQERAETDVLLHLSPTFVLCCVDSTACLKNIFRLFVCFFQVCGGGLSSNGYSAFVVPRHVNCILISLSSSFPLTLY
jgi:hypothetical protein